MKRLALMLSLLALASCTPFVPSFRFVGTPMSVVTNLDAARFMGKWYEIGRFPARFQDGCVGTTAEYTALPDGRIGVLNSCRIGTLDGEVREISGTAAIVAPGRLDVALQGVAFNAPFWVLYVSKDYRLAVIGTPTRTGGWVLSRDRKITPEQWDLARDVFERNNYDAAALQRTKQR